MARQLEKSALSKATYARSDKITSAASNNTPGQHKNPARPKPNPPKRGYYQQELAR